MAAYYGVNSITTIGNLAKDPIHFTTSTNADGAKFTLASSNHKGEVNFYSVVLYNSAATMALKYLHKGDKVYVQGELSFGSYETKNGKMFNIEIRCETIRFINIKKVDSEQNENTEDSTDDTEEDMPF